MRIVITFPSAIASEMGNDNDGNFQVSLEEKDNTMLLFIPATSFVCYVSPTGEFTIEQ